MRKIIKFLLKKRYIFYDEGGNNCGFGWWYQWKIAKWHWQKWLEYEGLKGQVKDINDINELIKFSQKIHFDWINKLK